MVADPEITNWILEFFLRQSLDFRALKSALRALPPPDDNHNLKKLLLLKKLESDISRNSVSETNLDIMALLAQVELQLGNETVPGTMRKAFCAAAVECTVKSSKGGGCEDGSNMFYFYGAVKRVWKGKIEGMKRLAEKGGLGSKELWEWKDEIERAVWDDDVYNLVLKKSNQVNGVEAVKAYIREEREKMGPSFLEQLAERMKSDENLRRILGVDGKGAPASTVDGSAGGSKDGNETTPGPSHEVADSIEVDKSEEALQHSPRDNHASAALDGNTSNEPRPNTRDLDESKEGSGMNLKKRRKTRWWIPPEEDVLRNAVAEHGIGNWNLILKLNKDIFKGRTEVDLKDKWRNMTKSRNTLRL